MCRLQAICWAITSVAFITGCGSEKDKEQQGAAAPPPEVTVSKVITRDITDTAEFTGRLESKETVEVRARVNGYITAIRFTDGQEVKRGDVLFEIDPRPFKAALDNAEGQKSQWQARLSRAKADVARYQKLVPTGAATPQDLDKARADLGEATAAIQSADATIERAKLDLEFSIITAPIAGQVSRALITVGNLVRSGEDLLTRIVSLDPIYFYFNVNERELLRFQDQSRVARNAETTQPDLRAAKIPVFVGLANEQGYPHRGVIDFGDNRVDPATGTIQIRAVLKNSERIFRPGLFARARVPTSTPYRAVLLTERAIGIDQGMKYVLTIDDNNVVKQRFIEPGPLQDDGLRVVKGLETGEWVVVNGLQRARPGKQVTPQRTEMPMHAAYAKANSKAATKTESTEVAGH